MREFDPEDEGVQKRFLAILVTASVIMSALITSAGLLANLLAMRLLFG